jgi:hypothetical protein
MDVMAPHDPRGTSYTGDRDRGSHRSTSTMLLRIGVCLPAHAGARAGHRRVHVPNVGICLEGLPYGREEHRLRRTPGRCRTFRPASRGPLVASPMGMLTRTASAATDSDRRASRWWLGSVLPRRCHHPEPPPPMPSCSRRRRGPSTAARFAQATVRTASEWLPDRP